MKRYLAAFPAALLLLPAALLAASNPAGLWDGTLKTPNGDMGFLFNLHRDGDRWAGEMDIPIQGVSALPLKDVKVDGASVSFPIPGPGDPYFEGKLAEDGKTIAGAFHQAGASIPLDLKWKSEARAVEKAPVNSGDVAVLEGVWEGALDANGNTLHVRFNFTKNADGSIAGTFDSLDQNATGLPVGSISRAGDSVKLDMKAIGLLYEGTLDKEASTLTGKMTQGGMPMPLNLKRKAAEKKN
ncbi:MAG TPA: hypothetical protein VKR61_24220 [Bryobacteraceae bacterium]|nr:hypothetical protein [Bryobacteraceae bacterium]